MSDSSDDKKNQPKPLSEKLTDEEQKEFIEKLKAQLTLEDNESIKLYAVLLKSCAL